MKNKKVIFMGTPKFSVPVLQTLIDEYNVVLVVTQPDKEVGRKKEIVFSEIKKLALKNEIEVFQPNKIRNDFDIILSLNPDIIITCAYGQIIPKEILECPEYGCINVHASLLPKLRGGAPIHHALIDGYDETGVTIMFMDEKMDTGDIITQESINILESDTVGTLHDKLSLIGAHLLEKTLPMIFSNKITRVKQDSKEATYGYVIDRDEEYIDFNRTTKEIFNHIRGLNPFPGAYAVLNNEYVKLFDCRIGSNTYSEPGVIFKLYSDGFGIATNDGEIIIESIQVSGKKKMLVKDYLNGINKDVILNQKFNK
ncbi:MAG TPA: methionyl-tRNA formyltransferase [Bacilli bacterium]|nr:methionyl-tRNA formyltransferase [Bacilli bacterium]